MYFTTTESFKHVSAEQNGSCPVCIIIGNLRCIFGRHPFPREDAFQKRTHDYHEKHLAISRCASQTFRTENSSKKSMGEMLREMQEIDIRSVNPADLVDIENVTIRTDLPVEERLRDFIHQIKNPYCYRSHGVTVKISFAGKRKLEDCLMSCIEMECGEIPNEDITIRGRFVG